MIDIFLSSDAQELLKDKYIVFLGDSNVRAIYKDLLCLLKSSKLIDATVLKSKMEKSAYGDKLVAHGEKSNYRKYTEERSAKIGGIRIDFFFVTRAYSEYVANILERITIDRKPDIIIANSVLWDLTRWGPNGVDGFKSDLQRLMKELKTLVPDCLVIWLTTAPISQDVKGGFLVKELQFFRYSLRFHIVEANHYARRIVVANGFDVLDLHHHLKLQIHRRFKDGVHWDVDAVRYITNLLLTHITLAYNMLLPGRFKSDVMQKELEKEMDEEVKILFKDTNQQIEPKSNKKRKYKRPRGNKRKPSGYQYGSEQQQRFISPTPYQNHYGLQSSHSSHQTVSSWQSQQTRGYNFQNAPPQIDFASDFNYNIFHFQ